MSVQSAVGWFAGRYDYVPLYILRGLGAAHRVHAGVVMTIGSISGLDGGRVGAPIAFGHG